MLSFSLAQLQIKLLPRFILDVYLHAIINCYSLVSFTLLFSTAYHTCRTVEKHKGLGIVRSYLVLGGQVGTVFEIIGLAVCAVPVSERGAPRIVFIIFEHQLASKLSIFCVFSALNRHEEL